MLATSAIFAVIALVLMVVGFMHKQWIWQISAALSWFIFGFLMFSQVFTNPSMNLGVLSFGAIMFFVCAGGAIITFTSGRRPLEREIDEEEEEHRRQVLRATRKR